MGLIRNQQKTGASVWDTNLEAAADIPKIPQVGQGVRIEGRDEVFVVLRTDVERGTVDVLQTSGIRRIRGGVPFSAVRIAEDRGKAATSSFTAN